MIQLEDSKLIESIKDGNVQAFEEFIRRYQKRLWFFVFRLIGNTGDIEEIVQDTFFSYYQHIDAVDVSKRVTNYLFTIAKNKAIDTLRQHKQTIRLEHVEEVYEDNSLFEQLDQEEQKLHVERVLRKLPKPYENIIRLYYMKELSYEEISRTLNIPINTVRTHIKRAKEKLKLLL